MPRLQRSNFPDPAQPAVGRVASCTPSSKHYAAHHFGLSSFWGPTKNPVTPGLSLLRQHQQTSALQKVTARASRTQCRFPIARSNHLLTAPHCGLTNQRASRLLDRRVSKVYSSLTSPPGVSSAVQSPWSEQKKTHFLFLVQQSCISRKAG